MTTPLVSVIVPTLGWERPLGRCLASIDAQTYDSEAWLLSICYDNPPHRDWGVWARLQALSWGHGEVIAYLDDDNAWRPHHLASLVPLLIDADFAYSRMAQHGRAGQYAEVGEWPPRLGGIDTSVIVHRRSLLELATWEPAGYASDWDLVRRWLEAGARGAFLDQVTMDYYD